VFNRLQSAGLCLKPSKCYLVRREVEYLGYVISYLGMAADPKKIKVVKEFPVPGNLKQLRLFLGIASYYRRFIKNFSKVADPLFALTRKDMAYEWTDQCQGAYVELKELLTTSPILAFPDFPKDSYLLLMLLVLDWVQSYLNCKRTTLYDQLHMQVVRFKSMNVTMGLLN